MKEKFFNIVKRLTGTYPSDSTTVLDLGMDSIDVAELSLAIENDFGKEIPQEKICRITGATTMLEIFNFIPQNP